VGHFSGTNGCVCTFLGAFAMAFLRRQAMYIHSNIEERSCNHFCSGKLISVTYCDFVFVDFGHQHAMRMHHIIICGLLGFKIFFHIIS
jgi:hypothetical protein